MVAEKYPRLVPASYLDGASCQLAKWASVSMPTLITGVETGDHPNAEELLALLTPAERLVAVHVAQGLSNKEISSALNRAEPTIKHQISSAMRKLGVQSRCQLIVRLLS